jgi:predicted secreted hydrolase
MFYNLRLRDGTSDANSAGTYVRPDGEAIHVGRDDVTLTVLDTWDSPEGGTYPARWRIAVPAAGIDVEVTPVMPDQELFTTVRYWEGAVDVSGTVSGRAADGVGYVELTGYAESPE